MNFSKELGIRFYIDAEVNSLQLAEIRRRQLEECLRKAAEYRAIIDEQIKQNKAKKAARRAAINA